MRENLKGNSNPKIEIPETKECLGYETMAPVEIRMCDLDQLLDLIMENRIRVIWSCNSLDCNKFKGAKEEQLNRAPANPDSRIFFFVKDMVIYSAESKGFKDLKDYVEAKDHGFLNAIAFSLLGCISKKYDVQSIASIYYDAMRYGYNNPIEFNKSYQFYGDFESFDTYKKEAVNALELGFKKYNDYYDAKNKNFSKGKEYYEAQELNIYDYCEYQDYLTLDGKMYDYGFDSCFEFHIFHILSRLRGGQTLKLEKLTDILRYESGTYSREWYDKSISEISEKLIEDVLSNHRKFKKLGKVISLEEQTTPGANIAYSLYRNNTIYIDGSNVAWNNGSRERGDRPYAKNIEIVVNQLERLGFKEISVLCDNNLYDVIEDKDIYERLSALHIISAVKRGNTADEWLLRFREGKDCYIISNDKYREYLAKYPELADHIIKFHVSNGEAEFDEKINQILDGIVPDNELPKLCHESNSKNVW